MLGFVRGAAEERFGEHLSTGDRRGKGLTQGMGTDRDLAARKQDSPLCKQELQEEAGATTPGMGRLTRAGSWQLWV